MNNYIQILYNALEKELGLIVETDDPRRLQQKLYAERRKLADSKLNALSISISRENPDSQVWIYRNEAKQKTS